jgi:FSR family fosmidomycin resistance protein-like MFS transporter
LADKQHLGTEVGGGTPGRVERAQACGLAGSALASGTLALYAAAHGAVDAACVGTLWSVYHAGALSSHAAWSAFFLYNLLAFAVQPLIGLGADHFRVARPLAAGGASVVAVAVGLAWIPGTVFAAVAVLGLGNAVFHVGGGVISLKAAPGRATPLGVFVAPGAAGVVAGTLVGRAGGPVWMFALALVPLAAGVLALPVPRFGGASSRDGDASSRPAGAGAWPAGTGSRPAGTVTRAAGGGIELIVLLLLFVVAARAWVGMAVVLPWKSDAWLLAGLTTGVVLGKALGGVLADRFGWRSVGVSALLVSIPLLTLGPASAAAGITGTFIFNMTMPITLVAVAHALHGHEGFAFGLTCLALFVGSAPVLIAGPGMSAATLVPAGLVAAGALWVGMGRLLPATYGRALRAPAAFEEGLE